MVDEIVTVRKPRIRQLLITLVATVVAWLVIHWIGGRAPAFGAFVQVGEAVVIVLGAYAAFRELRPRTHQRRQGDRRHAERRSSPRGRR